MRRFRKLASLIAVFLLLTLTLPAMASPETYDASKPALLASDQLYAASAVLIDADTGDVLFSKDSRVRMYPASTTKIMTALLALESGWDLNMQVTIPQEAADIASDSSTMPIYPGEKTSFGELIYGMMLPSGNDAANAVAVLMSGSVSAFVEKMNSRAAQLGCTGTHFANPHGYHDENHYSTAQDMALITQEAMKNATFREIVSTPYRVVNVFPRGEVPLYNSNKLIVANSGYYYEDCIGIKTGGHSRAGQCLVTAAERDGVTLIGVILHCETAEQRWTDALRLSKYGFTRYTGYTLDQMFEMASGLFPTVRVSNAIESDPFGGVLQLKLALISDPDYERMVVSGNETARTAALNDFAQRGQVTLADNLTAPVAEGEYVGTFSYTAQDGQVITASLIAGRSIEAQPEKTSIYDVFPFLKIFSNPLVLMLIAVLALLIVILILRAHGQRRRRERRRQEIYERKRREYARNPRGKKTAPSRRSPPPPPRRTSGNTRRPQPSSPRPSTVRPKRVASQDDDLFGGFQD